MIECFIHIFSLTNFHKILWNGYYNLYFKENETLSGSSEEYTHIKLLPSILSCSSNSTFPHTQPSKMQSCNSNPICSSPHYACALSAIPQYCFLVSEKKDDQYGLIYSSVVFVKAGKSKWNIKLNFGLLSAAKQQTSFCTKIKESK